MKDFPVKKLILLPGRLVAESTGFSIEIPVAPFTLDDEVVETEIRMDAVNLPTGDVQKLEGQTFSFPTNPHAGYIDASVYIQHAHHPVDVTSVRFYHATGESVEAEFEMLLVFEFEGLDDYSNTLCTLKTQISSH